MVATLGSSLGATRSDGFVTGGGGVGDPPGGVLEGNAPLPVNCT